MQGERPGRCLVPLHYAIVYAAVQFTIELGTGLPATAGCLERIFEIWPEERQLDHPLVAKSPSGTLMLISHMSHFEDSDGLSCVAQIRVEDDPSVYRRDARWNPASRVFGNKEQAARLKADETFIKEYVVSQISKTCKPVRIRLTSNVTNSWPKSYGYSDFFLESNGTYRRRDFEVCGP